MILSKTRRKKAYDKSVEAIDDDNKGYMSSLRRVIGEKSLAVISLIPFKNKQY